MSQFPHLYQHLIFFVGFVLGLGVELLGLIHSKYSTKEVYIGHSFVFFILRMLSKLPRTALNFSFYFTFPRKWIIHNYAQFTEVWFCTGIIDVGPPGLTFSFLSLHFLTNINSSYLSFFHFRVW